MPEWEDNLPPIARQKLAKIGEVSSEEKQRLKDLNLLTSMLSKFYQGELGSEDLWRELKGYKEQGKEYLLREAQLKLLDSLHPGVTAAELKKRREGLLAIETLKDTQNTSILEMSLNSIEGLQKRYKEGVDQAYNELKAQVERNPQLRMQRVKQGQNTIVVQLTVDETIKGSPQWKSFMTNQEKTYNQEFAGTIERLKKELK